MKIEYLTILRDNPALYPKDLYPNSPIESKNVGMDVREIESFRNYINQSVYPGQSYIFPQAYIEFLFLAGKGCMGLSSEYGYGEELMAYYLDLFNYYNGSIASPFVVFDFYDTEAYVLLLNETNADPNVYVIFSETTRDLVNQVEVESFSQPLATGKTLVKFIEDRVFYAIKTRDQ